MNIMASCRFAAFICLAAAVPMGAIAAEQQPLRPPAVAALPDQLPADEVCWFRGIVVAVTDGDTLKVDSQTPMILHYPTASRIPVYFEIERPLRFNVRMIDCWTPEKASRIAAEKALGIAAKNHLTGLALGQAVFVEIPVPADRRQSAAVRIDQALTFKRVAAHVRLVGDRQTLTARMIADKFAAPSKAEQKKLFGPGRFVK